MVATDIKGTIAWAQEQLSRFPPNSLLIIHDRGILRVGTIDNYNGHWIWPFDMPDSEMPNWDEPDPEPDYDFITSE